MVVHIYIYIYNNTIVTLTVLANVSFSVIWLTLWWFCLQIQEVKGDLTIETTESNSKLTIADSQQEHCGCYTVELRNNYGVRQAALNLTVVGMFHLFKSGRIEFGL